MTKEERRAALKAEFIRERGYWNSFWGVLLEDDPDYFEGYLHFSSAPWKHGTLSPKVREFLYIAIDTSATHMYKPGLRIHIQNALKHGATREEIMEVLELSAEIGIHSCTAGLPIVLDEARRAGVPVGTGGATSARAVELKARFVAELGEWNDTWEALLELAPEFFAAYLELASVPRRSQRLEPKTKELVLLALCAATTSLYKDGIRRHARNALRLGATVAELIETLQLISVLGIHACTMGMPVLLEEIERRKEPAAGSTTA